MVSKIKYLTPKIATARVTFMKLLNPLFRNPAAICSLLIASSIASFAQSTIDPTEKFAYSANAGWVNWRPSAVDGVVVTEYFLSGYAYAANFGWINFGDGTPSNGIQYSNASAGNFGVNHDGAGNLSGYAYGANVGWINFGWALPGDSDRPRIDTLTGEFSGYAYGANIGWINLGAGYLFTDSVHCPDSDTDGIVDSWELVNFTNLTSATATSDSDGDGALDVDEYLALTDPKDPEDRFRILSSGFDFSVPEGTTEFTSTPSRIYEIELADDLDLGSWSSSTLGTFAPDAGATTTTTFPIPNSAVNPKFFRVVIKKPLDL